jgi:predicted esterase
MKTECPNMKFIVVGYSQGGAIAAQGLSQIVSAGNANKVIGVVFYAPFGNAAPPSQFSDRKLIHCASGDAVSCVLSTWVNAKWSLSNISSRYAEAELVQRRTPRTIAKEQTIMRKRRNK